MATSYFNRTILELKQGIAKTAATEALNFNRTILELKHFLLYLILYLFDILIVPF